MHCKGKRVLRIFLYRKLILVAVETSRQRSQQTIMHGVEDRCELSSDIQGDWFHDLFTTFSFTYCHKSFYWIVMSCSICDNLLVLRDLQIIHANWHYATSQNAHQVTRQLRIKNAGQLVDPNNTCSSSGNGEMFFSHYYTLVQILCWL